MRGAECIKGGRPDVRLLFLGLLRPFSTVLPASRERDRELLRRTYFVGSSSPARFFHEAHLNVRTDSRLELRPLFLAVVLVATLSLGVQQRVK